MRTETVLSIIMPVYNHEAYVRQAIESILMQKTDFAYEVLIGEDWSPDGTRQVLQNMEKTLPECFHIYYREKNLGMYGNITDLFSRATGRYIITLEGDDYWLFDGKLQRQVDYLESHPDVVAVAHNSLVVNEQGQPIPGIKYPECHKTEYSLRHYRKGILPGQTATMMYRNYHLISIFPTWIEYVLFAMDTRIAFMLAANGRVHCIQQPWSAYRLVLSSGTSYTATFRDDDDFKRRMVLFYRSLYLYTTANALNGLSIRVSTQLFLFYRFRWSLGKNPLFTLSGFWKELVSARYKGAALAYILYRIVAHPVLARRRGWSHGRIVLPNVERKK